MNATGSIPRNPIGHGHPRVGVLDRAALALGEALVAWGNRRANPPTTDHGQLNLLVAAQHEAQRVAIDRDLAKARSYGLIR